LRGIIEPAAAALAAARRTEAQLDAMRKALDKMALEGLTTDAGQTADQDFHRYILQATHNDALASLASSVSAAVTWTTRFKHRQQPFPRDPQPEHEAVFAAIAAGNPAKARTAMKSLLRLALADMDRTAR